MRNLGQLFVGLLTALASSLIVLGAASLALLEGDLNVLPTATSLPASTPLPGETITIAPTEDNQGQPVSSTAQPPTCAVPPGWTVYTVKMGDTLEALADLARISEEEIYQKNCLDSRLLLAGFTLYLPLPTPTATVPLAPTVAPSETPTATVTVRVITCGPPPNWVRYTVQFGDNLFRLGLAYNISVSQLMFANCLNSDQIRAGQQIWVPYWAPRIPTRTHTPVIPDTLTPTPTRTETLPPVETTTVPTEPTDSVETTVPTEPTDTITTIVPTEPTEPVIPTEPTSSTSPASTVP